MAPFYRFVSDPVSDLYGSGSGSGSATLFKNQPQLLLPIIFLIAYGNFYTRSKLLAPNLEYDHEAADVGAEGGAKNGKVHGLVARSRVFIFLRYASICGIRLRRTDASSKNNNIKKSIPRKVKQIHCFSQRNFAQWHIFLR